MARTKTVAVPEVGDKAPEFHLSSAQGGQFRLSMRTAVGPVVVVFCEGSTEEEVAYFEGLAAREDEINMAGGSVVGIGVMEPDEARDFVKKTGIKSYFLYDYARIATREWGLLEKSKGRGEHARPATFVVGADHKVAYAWVGERPEVGEVLAKVSEITGLPKEPDADGGEEKPKRAAKKKAEADGEADGGAGGGRGKDAAGERKRLSPEQREQRRAERQGARGAGGKGGTTRGEEPTPEAEAKGDAGKEPGAEVRGAAAAGEKDGGEPEGEAAKEG